jgi:3-hydroxyisobutyrate dehydrogenase-like beta-hydroxyacid dehydrogenase
MTLSRRSLIGGGAALAGAAAATVASGGTSAFALTELSVQELAALDIPVMLSVTNAKKGELEILVGEQAITFTDKPLVAKLARTTRKEVG